MAAFFIFLALFSLSIFSGNPETEGENASSNGVANIKIVIDKDADLERYKGFLLEKEAIHLTIHCSHLKFLWEEFERLSGSEKIFSGILHAHLRYDDLEDLRIEAPYLNKILLKFPDLRFQINFKNHVATDDPRLHQVRIFVNNYQITSNTLDHVLRRIEMTLDKNNKDSGKAKTAIIKTTRSNSCIIF